MATPFPGNPQFVGHETVHNKNSMDKRDGGRWYFSRKEIEENSTSRRDGIDLKKETYLRKSYCTFLQDLGMRLKVPQVTIATAIMFCHRFFLRQSHAKNDRRTIATVCMFLAGKVEETPRPLKDVILVSYEIINKKDPAAIQRIKQKEVYEQQKEFTLLGERVVLATLGFDLNVQHPYKPLVEAIKKFKVAQNALAQVAWNFVNDGLRTSLCLQFKPHHIAAGAIFLAAKFLKVKLPSDGDKVWWQEFDVTARQLEEVSNQMLELYEQNRVPLAQGSEIDGSATAANQGMPPGILPSGDVSNSNFQTGAPTTGPPKTTSSQPIPEPRAGPSKPAAEPRPEPELPTIDEHRTVERLNGNNPEHEGMRVIDKDKVKAALRQRKMRGDIGRRTNLVDDEDDLIERELEEGIELANKGDRDSALRNRSSVTENEYTHKVHHHVDVENAEEGELPTRENTNHKRAGSPLGRYHDHHGGSHSEWMEEKRKMSKISHSERDHNWLFQGHHD